jgi:hypothetical protein
MWPVPYTCPLRDAQALRTAATLDDVCAATAGWLGDVLRQCCCGSPRGPGATWRHIGKQLQQLMGAAAAAAALHEQLQAARLAAARVSQGGEAAFLCSALS